MLSCLALCSLALANMATYHEGAHLTCAFSNPYDCCCDTDRRGCCAQGSHAELARHNGLPPNTCAGGWIKYAAGGTVEKDQAGRQKLHAAATQRGGADPTTDNKFFGTVLRINSVAKHKTHDAREAAVAHVLARHGLALKADCGHVACSERTKKGKVPVHTTSCLAYWVPAKGKKVLAPAANDDFGNRVKDALTVGSSTFPNGYVTEVCRANVGICGCHCHLSDLVDGANPRARPLALKPGAMPRTPGQLRTADTLSVSEAAGWTRGGARARDPTQYAAACVDAAALATPPRPAPAWCTVGSPVKYGGAAKSAEVGWVEQVTPLPRTPGHADYVARVKFPSSTEDVNVNELAPVATQPVATQQPLAPAPDFQAAAGCRVQGLQRELEAARATAAASQAALADAERERDEATARADAAQKASTPTGLKAKWASVRAGFKDHWQRCVDAVEQDPKNKPDVWSLAVVKRVLLAANWADKYVDLEAQMDRRPPVMPRIPEGVDPQQYVSANAGLFVGWERECTNYRTKVKQVLSIFLLAIQVTSQRCTEISKVVDAMMGPMPHKQRALLQGVFGLASSKTTNAKNVKKRMGTCHAALDARLLKTVQKLIDSGGAGFLALGWDDDHTKILWPRTLDGVSKGKKE
jgi:hypothetical protein